MKDTIDTGIAISHKSLPRWHNSFLAIIPRGRIYSAETKLGFQTQYKGSENVPKVPGSFAFLKADVNIIHSQDLPHSPQWGEKSSCKTTVLKGIALLKSLPQPAYNDMGIFDKY